jgi:hypothetical protein
MDPVNIVKTIIAIPMGLGIGTIVDNIVKTTTPSNTTRITQVLIKVGAFGLGGLLAHAATTKTNEEIDAVVDFVKQATKKPEVEE